MYIILSMEKTDSEYVFIQWISCLSQAKKINHGLEVLIYTLKELRQYFVRKMFKIL